MLEHQRRTMDRPARAVHRDIDKRIHGGSWSWMFAAGSAAIQQGLLHGPQPILTPHRHVAHLERGHAPQAKIKQVLGCNKF